MSQCKKSSARALDFLADVLVNFIVKKAAVWYDTAVLYLV